MGFGEKPIEELERLDFEKLTLSLSYILSFSYIFYFLSLSLSHIAFFHVIVSLFPRLSFWLCFGPDIVELFFN